MPSEKRTNSAGSAGTVKRAKQIAGGPSQEGVPETLVRSAGSAMDQSSTWRRDAEAALSTIYCVDVFGKCGPLHFNGMSDASKTILEWLHLGVSLGAKEDWVQFQASWELNCDVYLPLFGGTSSGVPTLLRRDTDHNVELVTRAGEDGETEALRVCKAIAEGEELVLAGDAPLDRRVRPVRPWQPLKRTDVNWAVWCVDCWALAQEPCLCRGAHKVVDWATARGDVSTALATARREADRLQGRLDTLAEAQLLALTGPDSTGPVLSAHVSSVNVPCWSISGGPIRLTLAATESLADEEVRAVCEALEGLELEYDYELERDRMAYAGVDARKLKGVLKKLVDCSRGQAVPEGAILLSKSGCLKVAFCKTRSKMGGDTKLLGLVLKEDLWRIQVSGCDDFCQRKEGHQDYGKGTTLTNVKLAA